MFIFFALLRGEERRKATLPQIIVFQAGTGRHGVRPLLEAWLVRTAALAASHHLTWALGGLGHKTKTRQEVNPGTFALPMGGTSSLRSPPFLSTCCVPLGSQLTQGGREVVGTVEQGRQAGKPSLCLPKSEWEEKEEWGRRRRDCAFCASLKTLSSLLCMGEGIQLGDLTACPIWHP